MKFYVVDLMLYHRILLLSPCFCFSTVFFSPEYAVFLILYLHLTCPLCPDFIMHTSAFPLFFLLPRIPHSRDHIMPRTKYECHSFRAPCYNEVSNPRSEPMKYKNANDILPKELLVSGGSLQDKRGNIKL